SFSTLFTLHDGASTTVSYTTLSTGFALSKTKSLVSKSRALGIFPTAASSAIAVFGTVSGSSTTSKITSGAMPDSSPTPTTQSNLAMALELNSLFQTLKGNSTCNPDHPVEATACVEGRVALCDTTRKYLFIQ